MEVKKEKYKNQYLINFTYELGIELTNHKHIWSNEMRVKFEKIIKENKLKNN